MHGVALVPTSLSSSATLPAILQGCKYLDIFQWSHSSDAGACLRCRLLLLPVKMKHCARTSGWLL